METEGSAKSHTRSLFVWIVIGFGALYVSGYLVLSSFGQYRPLGMGGLSHWEEYSSWEPAGFRVDARQSGPLRLVIMKMFSPLWIVDVRWLHNHQDVYTTARRSVSGEWIYKTNSWVRDANGQWILTNYQPATASSK